MVRALVFACKWRMILQMRLPYSRLADSGRRGLSDSNGRACSFRGQKWPWAAKGSGLAHFFEGDEPIGHLVPALFALPATLLGLVGDQPPKNLGLHALGVSDE